MPKLDCPLQLSPVFKPKIWGRHNLDPLFERPENPVRTKSAKALSAGSAPAASEIGKNDLIGEVWITDDQSRFLTARSLTLLCQKPRKNTAPDSWGAAGRSIDFQFWRSTFTPAIGSRFKYTRAMITRASTMRAAQGKVKCGISSRPTMRLKFCWD